MGRRSQSHYKSRETIKRNIAYDFSGPKGVGASIVFDPEPRRPRTEPSILDPAEIDRVRRERRDRKPKLNQPDPRLPLVKRTLIEHEISPTSFLATAQHLAAFSRDQYKPIPMNVRAAMAIAVETAGGTRQVADMIRLGKMDDHLHHLVRRK